MIELMNMNGQFNVFLSRDKYDKVTKSFIERLSMINALWDYPEYWDSAETKTAERYDLHHTVHKQQFD